jgi:hypothetical protein
MIFGTFGIVRSIIQPADYNVNYFLALNFNTIAMSLVILLIFVHFGSSTRKAAEETLDSIGELVRFCLPHISFGETMQLMVVLIQLQARKVRIENVFFSIDWKVLMTVRNFDNF